VNVDTDLRMALTGGIRKVFAENPSEFDPRKCLAPGVAAMQAVCHVRFEQFGSAGRASNITAKPLSEMAGYYA
jgi:fructose-bisphosphate aldolase class II